MSRLTIHAVFIALLAGCVEPVVPPFVVPDDDDSAVDDDDDTTLADDDDSSIGDDDDVTDPPPAVVLLQADAPVGSVVLVQDGDGPWAPLALTDLAGEFTVADPQGEYGVLLACVGLARATTRVHLSTVAAEPSVVLACSEEVLRDGAGVLSGDVIGVEGDLWSLFVGSRAFQNLSSTLTEYMVPGGPDHFDLIAHRLGGDGTVNLQMILRVLDSGADPNAPIDFWNVDSGAPHTPEGYDVEVTVPATSVTTHATWLSRGGTVVPLGTKQGAEVSFPLISNERRFDDEVAITDTISAYEGGCAARTLAIVDSDLMLDNAVVARHSNTLMSLDPLPESVCADAAAPSISADTALTVDWSGALTGGAPTDVLRVALASASGAQRWILSAAGGRTDQAVDLTAVGALVGEVYGAPAAGWTWKSSAWSLPAAGVPAGVPMLVLDTNLFEDLPRGRSRFRFERVDAADLGERNHEYEEDDLTRPIIILPWDMDEWAVKGITRSGTL